MISRRNRHIEFIWRDNRLEPVQRALRHGGLQQGRAIKRSDKAPRRIIGPWRGQSAQDVARVSFVCSRFRFAFAKQRQGTDLCEKGVPDMALVWAQGSETLDLVMH